MIKENESKITKKSYKGKFFALVILITSLGIVWVEGYEFKKHDAVNIVENQSSYSDFFMPDLLKENTGYDEDLIKENSSFDKEIHHENEQRPSSNNFYSDLLEIYIDLDSKRNCLNMIEKLESSICNHNCPKEIKNAFKYLKALNNENHFSNYIIFPTKNNFFQEIVGSIIRVEKFNPNVIYMHHKLVKHIGVIKDYINQVNGFSRND